MNSIRKLTRFRWNLLALAELKRLEGCKFVTLVRRLNASDKAIRQSLDYMIEEGWIARNPGYGHPSRPEYLLTQEGDLLGSIAMDVADWLGTDRRPLATDRWALPVIASLGSKPLRFSELRTNNAPISPRALALTLKLLSDEQLVVRSVTDGFPPSVGYSLSVQGADLAGKIPQAVNP